MPVQPGALRPEVAICSHDGQQNDSILKSLFAFRMENNLAVRFLSKITVAEDGVSYASQGMTPGLIILTDSSCHIYDT